MPNRTTSRRKVRTRPRISAPKLGEYMDVLSARQRERIVHRQKFPAAFITARYQEAFSAVRASMLSGDQVMVKLQQHAERIERTPASTRHQASAHTCSAQAVRRFARLVGALGLDQFEVALPGPASMKVSIEGVSVSVVPAVVLSRATRSGRASGAMLVVMNKTIGLSDRGGEAVAELLRQALVQAGHEGVRPDLCLVVDVFRDRVYHAPRAAKRLSEEIASACREIAMRWETLAA